MMGVHVERSHTRAKGCTRQLYTCQEMRVSRIHARTGVRAPRGHAHERGTRTQGRCARRRAHMLCALWVAVCASGYILQVLALSMLPRLHYGQGGYIFRSRIMVI